MQSPVRQAVVNGGDLPTECRGDKNRILVTRINSLTIVAAFLKFIKREKELRHAGGARKNLAFKISNNFDKILDEFVNPLRTKAE